MTEYQGPLVRGSSREVRRAYNIYHGQKARCENPKSKPYKYYGAKGIRVEYNVRQFIFWWLSSIEGKSFDRPTCGRIDHSKNYSLDNIEIQECSDNTLELYNRLGKPPSYKRKVCILNQLGEPVIFFQSIKAAQQLLKIENISRSIKMDIKAGGFKFKYFDGGVPSLS
jgi:hypothetical protein